MKWIIVLCVLTFLGVGICYVVMSSAKPAITESTYPQASDVPWAGKIFDNEHDFGPVIVHEKLSIGRYRIAIILGKCDKEVFTFLYNHCSTTQPLMPGTPMDAERLISQFETKHIGEHLEKYQIQHPFQMFSGKLSLSGQTSFIEVFYCEKTQTIHIGITT